MVAGLPLGIAGAVQENVRALDESIAPDRLLTVLGDSHNVRTTSADDATPSPIQYTHTESHHVLF